MSDKIITDSKVSSPDSTQPFETQKTILNSNSSHYSKSRLFVPTTILFCLPVILLLYQISINFMWTDYYSYILLIVGGITIFRSYMVTFLTMSTAYFKHKWLLFSFNLAIVIVTLWSVYRSIFDLMNNYYPETWFVGMVSANLLFLAQIWLNRVYNNTYMQVQLLQIIFLMICTGALWQHLLKGAIWLNIMALIVGLFEVYLVSWLVKILFKWETEHRIPETNLIEF